MNRQGVLLAFMVSSFGGGCFSALRTIDGIACDSAMNCPDGYWCDVLDRQCRPGTSDSTCVRDVDCPFGAICVDSACAIGCTEDGDCGLEQACIDGQCASDPLSCNDDSLCDYGYRCDVSAKRCVPHPASDVLCKTCVERFCLTSSDCLSGDRCVRPDPDRYGTCEICGGGGRCNEEGSLETCSSNAECGGGEICYKAGCQENAHCSFGGRSFGSCTPRPYNPDGKKALEGLRSCSLGFCSKAFCATTSCLDREDACPKGWGCATIVDAPVQDECAQDADCAGERTCVTLRNEARPIRFCSCLSNADCESGVCDANRCILRSECRPAPGLTCEELTR